MGIAAPVYYTADIARALPDDGNRYETVRGDLLVTPAAELWHQEVAGQLYEGLRAYLRRYPVGHALASPADISWSPDTLIQPDVFVADLAEVRTLDWSEVKHLLLAVEVISRTTARYDRFTKRRLYQEVEVPAYWIVDPDQRLEEVWTPDDELPITCCDSVTRQPAGAAQPLSIQLAELFRAI